VEAISAYDEAGQLESFLVMEDSYTLLFYLNFLDIFGEFSTVFYASRTWTGNRRSVMQIVTVFWKRNLGTVSVTVSQVLVV
jgi:hypothetical protein